MSPPTPWGLIPPVQPWILSWISSSRFVNRTKFVSSYSAAIACEVGKLVGGLTPWPGNRRVSRLMGGFALGLEMCALYNGLGLPPTFWAENAAGIPPYQRQ